MATVVSQASLFSPYFFIQNIVFAHNFCLILAKINEENDNLDN